MLAVHSTGAQRRVSAATAREKGECHAADQSARASTLSITCWGIAIAELAVSNWRIGEENSQVIDGADGRKRDI